MKFDLTHRYSDNIYHKRIALLGPFPPPLGGISVHIKRVKEKLLQQKNTVFIFDSTVELRFQLSFLYVTKLFFWLLIRQPEILIYHTMYVSNSVIEMKLLLFFKKFFKFQLFFIDHDCRYLYTQSNGFIAQYKNILKQVDKLVLIGDKTYQSYKDYQLLIKNISIEGAFLPPNMNEEKNILATYPDTLFRFIKYHQPNVLINAFQLRLLNGKDLYGIDSAITLIDSLKKDFSAIGLIIVLGQIGNQHYFKMIKQNKLDQNIYILHGHYQLWPLFKKVDLFLRPTLSDSYGISIAESLYFKTPAIASDVCQRPEQTILYKKNDNNELEKKVREVLYAKNNIKCHYSHTQSYQ